MTSQKIIRLNVRVTTNQKLSNGETYYSRTDRYFTTIEKALDYFKENSEFSIKELKCLDKDNNLYMSYCNNKKNEIVLVTIQECFLD